MKYSAALICASVVLFVLPGIRAADEQEWTASALKFAPAKGDLNFATLHGQEFAQVCHERSDYYIPVPYKKKLGIMAGSDEDCTYLTIDCDSDYKLETKITGKGGFATVKLIYDDDTISSYTMKLVKGDQKAGGRLEVDFKMSGNQLQIGMANVKAFGSANEEYTHFKPRPLLPQIEILSKTGATMGRGAVAEPTDGC